MPISTVPAFIDALKRYPLLGSAQLNEVTGELQAKCTDPRALARELLQRGWLTAFQINRLFQERGQDLVLGSYVLLELLGEGGMGAVYKARHVRLDRIDAVKLIRKDLLTKQTAVERFQREARAAARLSHPNVVTIYDANEIGGTHFLAMEYFPGTDLSRMVKQNGPLPIGQACQYISQAARGLQHAHERGLVHRDIKPSNLLLVKAQPPQTLGVVKILDLGLARLAPLGGQPSAECLTETGTVVGTADFIAPEQARNASEVDSRADLYSLGCTFYFLLTGKIPFPGETLTEKLLAHQLEAPEPVEKLRPDVPAAVVGILRQMMAKRAEDRYQTMAELAQALQPFTGATGEPPPHSITDRPRQPMPVGAIIVDPVPSGNTLPAMPLSGPIPLARVVARRPSWFLLAAALGLAGFLFLLLVGGAALWAFTRVQPRPTVAEQPPTRPTANAQVKIDLVQAKLHFERGNGHYDARNYDQAIAEYTEAIRCDPGMAGAFNERGRALSQKGKHNEAITDFTEAIRLKPDYAAAFFNRASAYYAKGGKGDLDRSLADNSQVIRLTPNNAVAWNNRGTCYSVKGQVEMAILDFTKAIELNSKYASAYGNRGAALTSKGDPDKAIADLDLAINLESGNAGFFNSRGNAYAQKGDFDQAIADYTEAIRLERNYAGAYFNRCRAYDQKGNRALADKDYQRAIQLDPNLAKLKR